MHNVAVGVTVSVRVGIAVIVGVVGPGVAVMIQGVWVGPGVALMIQGVWVGPGVALMIQGVWVGPGVAVMIQGVWVGPGVAVMIQGVWVGPGVAVMITVFLIWVWVLPPLRPAPVEGTGTDPTELGAELPELLAGCAGGMVGSGLDGTVCEGARVGKRNCDVGLAWRVGVGSAGVIVGVQVMVGVGVCVSVEETSALAMEVTAGVSWSSSPCWDFACTTPHRHDPITPSTRMIVNQLVFCLYGVGSGFSSGLTPGGTSSKRARRRRIRYRRFIRLSV
jgi:hypothetical protein